MKKILATLLSLVLCLGMLAAPAAADGLLVIAPAPTARTEVWVSISAAGELALAYEKVTVIDTDDVKNFREIPLPAFQEMRLLEGDRGELEEELRKLAAEGKSIWCSVENTGSYEPLLLEILSAVIRESRVKIIRCRNRETNPAVLQRLPEERKLEELAPVDVFKLILQEAEINKETAEKLLGAFNEIETAVREEER